MSYTPEQGFPYYFDLVKDDHLHTLFFFIVHFYVFKINS